MEQEGPAEYGSRDQTVQDQRTGEVAAKIVTAGVVVRAELEVSGYRTVPLFTFESAG